MQTHTARAGRSFVRLGLESLESRMMPSATLPTPTPALVPAVVSHHATPAIHVSSNHTPAVSHRSSVETVDASYHWSISSGPVVSGSNNATDDGSSMGDVAFALARDTQARPILNGPAVSLRAPVVTSDSAADDYNPDVYHTLFTLRLQVTDADSGRAAVLSFTGLLSGTVSYDNSSLTATIQGSLTQRVQLGDHWYTVAFQDRTSQVPAPGDDPLFLGVTIQVSSS